jgi:hypothetical protein
MKLICTRGFQYEYIDPETRKQYFSVSQVLQVMDPDAFAGIDPFILAAAQDRGKDLHILFALTMLWIKGIGEKPIIPGGTIGKYYMGITKFMAERKPRAIRVEAQGVNDKLKTAGTLDFHGTLDDIPTEWIIDLKTGPERAVHSAQLIGGYKRLSGSEKAKRFASLYITKTGTYHLQEHTHDHVDQAGFDGALTTLNWRRHRHIT